MTEQADQNQQQTNPLPDPGWEVDGANAYKWTSDAYDLLLAGKLNAAVAVRSGVTQASADGECPRCHHQFQWHQVLDAVVYEPVRTLGVEQTDSAGYVGLTVQCTCTEPHTGRPPDVTSGCGINFRIEVNATGGNQ